MLGVGQGCHVTGVSRLQAMDASSHTEVRSADERRDRTGGHLGGGQERRGPCVARRSSTPPRKNAQGISIRSSALTRTRTRCGTTRPMKPIGPVSATVHGGEHRAGEIAERATDAARRAPRVRGPRFAHRQQVPLRERRRPTPQRQSRRPRSSAERPDSRWRRGCQSASARSRTTATCRTGRESAESAPSRRCWSPRPASSSPSADTSPLPRRGRDHEHQHDRRARQRARPDARARPPTRCQPIAIATTAPSDAPVDTPSVYGVASASRSMPGTRCRRARAPRRRTDPAASATAAAARRSTNPVPAAPTRADSRAATGRRTAAAGPAATNVTARPPIHRHACRSSSPRHR